MEYLKAPKSLQLFEVVNISPPFLLRRSESGDVCSGHRIRFLRRRRISGAGAKPGLNISSKAVSPAVNLHGGSESTPPDLTSLS